MKLYAALISTLRDGSQSGRGGINDTRGRGRGTCGGILGLTFVTNMFYVMPLIIRFLI